MLVCLHLIVFCSPSSHTECELLAFKSDSSIDSALPFLISSLNKTQVRGGKPCIRPSALGFQECELSVT